jgi:DNA-binding transcriptional MerR regulator
MTVTESRAIVAPSGSDRLLPQIEQPGVEPAGQLSVAEVAAITGLSGHTLRYYERTGLMLRPIERAASQQRRYTPADVTWIRFLTKLRSTAMPIATVREYVELARRGDSTSEQRLSLLQRHRADVIAQLHEVTDSLAAIEFKIATYQNSLDRQERNDQP